MIAEVHNTGIAREAPKRMVKLGHHTTLLGYFYCLLLQVASSKTRHTRSLRVPVSSIFGFSESSSVPRIIHQSWKDENVPLEYREWQQSWKDKHPNWKYNLWTDEMNLRLVEEHFKWFLPIYKEFPLEILRADSVRYMYMYKFGGVYADLDFRALKPMGELLKGAGHKAVVGRLSDQHDWEQNIPNAWLASSPGHPFWMFCLMEIAKGASWVQCDGDDCTKDYIIERTTGPWMLWRSVRYFQNYADAKDGTLTVLEPGAVYPLSWNAPYPDVCLEHESSERACYEHFSASGSFAITYWSHSWGDGSSSKGAL